MNFNTVSSSPLRRLVTAATLAAAAGAAPALPLASTGPSAVAAWPGPSDGVPIASTGISPRPGPNDVVPIGATGAGLAGMLSLPATTGASADLAAAGLPETLRSNGTAVAAVPEPGRAPMAALGLLLLAAWRCWRRRKALRRGRPAVAD